jgi:hypothetical protein
MPSPKPDSLGAIRTILAARGLTLAEISRQSRIRFSGNPLFRIPPNFYDALRHASFSPSLHQLFALSVLTGYRLADWLSVFGFSFDDAAGFQAAWPRYQTAELDARVYDPGAEVSWFHETQSVQLGKSMTPLSRWLSGSKTCPLSSLLKTFGHSFRYLKIGSRDVYAFPDLLPGSIARIDGRPPAEELLSDEKGARILAIEHSRGIVCSRLRPAGRGRVVLCSGQLPYAPVELQLGTEARILGAVDFEIRPLASLYAPEVSSSAARVWTPAILKSPKPSGGVGDCIRRTRARSGLSFREASERTRDIATILGHPNYFCAPSALSDIEARDLFPRHIHKLISLSAVYCLAIADLARLGGLNLEDAGKEALPGNWKQVPRRQGHGDAFKPSRFLGAVRDTLEEVPPFLREALPRLLGLPNLSVRDLFWAGASGDLLHPYLRDSTFLAVNRRSKTPATSLSSPIWAQPLYVLETREGNRMCGACSLQNGTLLVRPWTATSGTLLKLRNRVDADILGRVVAIARRVAHSSPAFPISRPTVPEA